jgi:hypothetical protein
LARVTAPAPPATDTHASELVEEMPEFHVPAAVTRELAHVPATADDRCQALCLADDACGDEKANTELVERYVTPGA